jgi:hypothetical protein
MVCRVTSPSSERRVSRRRALPRAASSRRGRAIATVIALGAGIAAATWFRGATGRPPQVVLQFEGVGAAGPPIELVFFPEQFAFAAPSPPPPIGRLVIESGDTVAVGDDLVPDRAVVRYAATGFGPGFRHVELGSEARRIALRPPQTLHGRVVEPLGVWCFGWRSTGELPVAGAEVSLMGGGEHGIVLGEGRTGADGSFTIDGVDLEVGGLGLRVRAPGYAIHHESLERDGAGALRPVAPLVRTSLVRGVIDAPPDVDPTSLRILARGLPGVQATPAPDGSFELDHVPSHTRPLLLVHGLPPSLAHDVARAAKAQVVHIDVVPAAIVRGRVVDAATDQPVSGAFVHCGEGLPVRTDGHGAFELSRLLPGSAEIRAQFQPPLTGTSPPRWPPQRTGSAQTRLEGGKTLEGLVIRIR